MKNIKTILFFLLALTTFYYSSVFVGSVSKNQEILYLNFEQQYFSIQELLSNILNSCEATADQAAKITDPSLLKDQISGNLISIAVLDEDKKFLYGWEMDIDQHEAVSPISSSFLPESKTDLNWVNIDLNSKLYTCRGYYILKQENDTYLLFTFSLIPAIDAMGFLSFGFNSFPYIAYNPTKTVINDLKFSKPSLFSRLLNEPILIETRIDANWTLVFSGDWADLYPYSIPEIHFLFYILILWILLLTSGTALALNANTSRPKSLWATSCTFSILSLFLIVFLFFDLPTVYKETKERTLSFRKLQELPKNSAILIPTAFYLESLGFPNDSSFVVSGFISQIYPKHTELEIGFIFPNESITYPAKITEISRWENSTSFTILWHFSVGLMSSFPPLFFPFDSRTVPINLWPKEIHTDIIFFPNFLNYHDVSMQSLLSIDSNVNPIGWEITNSTYLLVGSEAYDFFGFSHLPISFKYTVSLERDFLGAFLSNILVLTLCMLVAFLVLFIPPNSLLNSLFATISIFVGLIFIAVTNHAALHTNLQASSFAYCEYLFISFYIIILAITVDFIFRIGDPNPKKDLLLIRAVSYWPLLLSTFIVCMATSIL
jgi:hypothetical protein